jgi:pimeloyl-ACP methyl ester carboxylesterase
MEDAAGDWPGNAAFVRRAVLDDAAVDRAIVVGLSIGGSAAIRAAVRNPDRVCPLVLAGTGAGTMCDA